MNIGITGRYCAGKSIASSVFEENGFAVIDVDGVGHEALEVKKIEIAAPSEMKSFQGAVSTERSWGARCLKARLKKKNWKQLFIPGWSTGS